MDNMKKWSQFFHMLKILHSLKALYILYLKLQDCKYLIKKNIIYKVILKRKYPNQIQKRIKMKKQIMKKEVETMEVMMAVMVEVMVLQDQLPYSNQKAKNNNNLKNQLNLRRSLNNKHRLLICLKTTILDAMIQQFISSRLLSKKKKRNIKSNKLNSQRPWIN